jgi:PmbA protein
VKGGFLMRQGERIPIKETLIAGNLYEALNRVSGISAETRLLNGRLRAPAIRLEDISVTAG